MRTLRLTMEIECGPGDPVVTTYEEEITPAQLQAAMKRFMEKVVDDLETDGDCPNMVTNAEGVVQALC